LKERVLALCLKDAVEAFDINKWKFFEDLEDEKMVKIEVPRGYTETYVVELPYGDNQGLRKDFIQALQENGFYQQKIRSRSSY